MLVTFDLPLVLTLPVMNGLITSISPLSALIWFCIYINVDFQQILSHNENHLSYQSYLPPFLIPFKLSDKLLFFSNRSTYFFTIFTRLTLHAVPFPLLVYLELIFCTTSMKRFRFWCYLFNTLTPITCIIDRPDPNLVCLVHWISYKNGYVELLICYQVR